MCDRPKRQDLIVGVIDALSLVVEGGLCVSQPHGRWSDWQQLQ